MDFIDLFSGIGGFRLGLEKADREIRTDPQQRNGTQEGRYIPLPQGGDGRILEEFRCVWSCDNDRYANQIYTAHFGREDHFAGDVRAIKAEELPSFDLLCAGFPCQSFSVAGKRKGLQDPRGTLFYEILRVARAKRPSLLLLENVPGLLSQDGGRAFATILRSLDEMGYWVEWQVLNSKYHGVPQNRARVFIVGHSRERDSTPLFPVQEGDRYARERTEEGESPQVVSGITGTYRGNMRGTYMAELSNTLCDGWLMETKHHSKPMNEYRIRRLTPVECERLQGFPDNWTEGVSDTRRYMLLGNAVTVNVIEFLGRMLRRVCS